MLDNTNNHIHVCFILENVCGRVMKFFFLTSFFFASPSLQFCTKEERDVWIGNDQFTADYQEASARAFGAAAGTTAKLMELYGASVTEPCLTCLGKATECGRDNCFFQCLVDQQSDDCRSCVNQYCIPDLLECTRATSIHELPMPVTQTLSTPPPSPVRVRKTTVSSPSSTTTEAGKAVGDDLSKLPFDAETFSEIALAAGLAFALFSILLTGYCSIARG